MIDATKSLTILLCHNYYPLRGGEDLWTDNLERLLMRHGHRVVRLSADTRDAERLGRLGQLGVGLEAIYSFRTVRRIHELVRTERPDLAHVANVFPYLSPSLYHALAAERIPVVQTLHNFRPFCPNSLFYTQGAVCLRCKDGHVWNAVRHRCVRNRTLPSLSYALAVGAAWLSRAYPRKLGTVITLNEFTARLWTERSRAAPEVLGNYIDCSTFSLRNSHDAHRLVYLGVLQTWKGVATLLRAMAALPEFHLDIIGEGPQKPDLQAFAHAQGLKNVEFMGWRGSERFEHLARALTLIVPSEMHDQFPTTILEAFALGVPVIGSRMGGIPSLVRPGETGYLFPAGDAQALAEHVRRLSGDDDLTRALGVNARRLVETHYTPEHFYQRLMAIYLRSLSQSEVRRGHG